jgi:carbamoyltransferase
MRILGISALSHDAAIAVVDGGEVLFAAHAERYSRRKNDPDLNEGIISDALAHGEPDVIAWYERPLVKKSRQFMAGQWRDCFAMSDLPGRYLARFGLDRYPLEFVPHHESHAAAGYFTSPFDDAAVIVLDAIGEWGTVSIGEYRGDELQWYSQSTYPHSLGLLYTAFTQRCGLRPNEEEYILMGMAAYGQPIHVDRIREDFIESIDPEAGIRLKENVHTGIGDWFPEARREDIASSIQSVTEDVLLNIVRWTASRATSRNLVLMGGVALNCVANERTAHFWAEHAGRKDAIWIMPNPGDGGSSLGAAAALFGRHLNWRGPYLGTDIDRSLDISAAAAALERGDVIAVANGRAEFGPRALGNRSLICDPRGRQMKDKVNDIKKRDLFRPFAPVVLEEHADAYFDMPVAKSPYMQFTAPCRDPRTFPAVCHVDGSSRVQTLRAEENPTFHALLSDFFSRTGCPILLNTSLNIKGEPLVDTWSDALRFSERNGVAVY